MYYLNNGSLALKRACVIVSSFLLFLFLPAPRVTLLVTEEKGRKGRVRREGEVVLFRVEEEKTERADGEDGGEEGRESVPCRIAVTAKTELRCLKTKGYASPSAPSLAPFSPGPERTVTESFLAFQ